MWVIGLASLAGVAGGLYWLLRPLPLVEPTRTPGAQLPLVETPKTGAQVPEDLAGLIRMGRLDDAFAVVQDRLNAGRPPPVEDAWALAQGLLGAGRLDHAFAVMRELANSGHGPAAFALAEMYDPLHWSRDRSALSKPNREKARDWYRRAADAGAGGADVRLRALDAAEGGQ
jgi:TPR repeat protein